MGTVRVSHLDKSFGVTHAVRDVSLEVGEGQLVVLLGPAGAGKTTTLRLIAGLERADRGEIYFSDREVSALPAERRNVALVFEDYALYPHMTVYDNLAFPLRAPNRSPRPSQAAIDERVRSVARVLGIGSLLERLPAQLSGGQRQRVGLGRALVRDPDVLLLDEPIAHLDAKLRHEMRTELKRIQKDSGVTTIYATPDYTEAMALADEIAVLRAGSLEQHGTPDDVFGNPASEFVAQLMGDPAMNLLPASLQSVDGELRLELDGVALSPARSAYPVLQRLSPAKGVVVGIRPTDVTLSLQPVPGSFPAEVVTAQPRGANTVYTLAYKGRFIRAKVGQIRAQQLRDGKAVHVQLPAERLLFFDPADGRRLAAVE